jgi:phosphoribosylanthranilate isomerase
VLKFAIQTNIPLIKMLNTKVKASSITNLTDARYFAAWEVEWLGFTLEVGNEFSVSSHLVNAIKAWVDGVKIVGEFGLATPSEIKIAAESMNLDAVQVGMFTSLNEVKALKGIPILKEIIVDRHTSKDSLEEILDAFEPYSEAFILNFDKNQINFDQVEKEEILSISALQALCKTYPIILSMNFNSNILVEILEKMNPLGINIRGGEEEKVGFKSFDELDEIFEAIEILV